MHVFGIQAMIKVEQKKYTDTNMEITRKTQIIKN